MKIRIELESGWFFDLVQRFFSTRRGRLVGIMLLMAAPVGVFAAVSKPYTFTDGAPISAAQVNSNFDTLVTAANALEFGMVPLGSIVAWHKSLAGTPALPLGWVECNGQVLNDPTSAYNGRTIPNLNNEVYAGGRGYYLRGGQTSGQFNNSSRFSGNGSRYDGIGNGSYYGATFGRWNDTENGNRQSYSTSDNNLGYPYVQVAAMTVVYIMRVK